MAKKFYFDDELDNEEFEYDLPTRDKKTTQQSYSNESLKTKPSKEKKTKQKKSTKDENGKLKKRYIVLGILGAIVLATIIYCIVISLQSGPVYGKRCKGLVTQITESDISSAEEKMLDTYSEIKTIDYEIACKQVKIDIVFNSGTDASDAEEIGQHAAMVLDEVVGLEIKDGDTYSSLFGVSDGENQYEVNLYMLCDGNEDYPIYGTKTARSDTFGFTLASVKDEESRQKALDTKETE